MYGFDLNNHDADGFISSVREHKKKHKTPIDTRAVYLTTKEVAKLAGCCQASVLRAIQSKKLNGRKTTLINERGYMFRALVVHPKEAEIFAKRWKETHHD